MKHLILAAALLGTTATTVLAQQSKPSWPAPPTEETVKAGKQSLIDKTKDLEAAVAHNNTTNAEHSAYEILPLMKTRMEQMRYTAEAHTGAQKDAIMKHMLDLEKRVSDFNTAAKDVAANGQKLVTQAHEYIQQY